jgi:hypothetical protein
VRDLVVSVPAEERIITIRSESAKILKVYAKLVVLSLPEYESFTVVLDIVIVKNL